MKHFSGDISLVLGGAAGQGIQTVEVLLMQVLKREGYNVFASKEYMSRVRGGSNSTEIRISSQKQDAFLERIDFLFVLDKEVIPHLEHRISPDTILLGERSKVCETECRVIDVSFTRFASELGHPLYTSTVAVGIALGLLGADEEIFKEYLREHFARKGEEVVKKNIEAAGKGYAFGKHLAYDESIEISLERDESLEQTLLLDGHEAVGLGALSGGCNYISSYPMTPGSGVLEFFAKHAKTLGVVVDQAEDEVSAINHGIGAWYAGARAIVSTSGGGFDLMTEGVSLAGMIETPMVIHMGQRPGPSTGLPTRTEQADLNLVLYAGHGEFPRAIFAPGTLEEAFIASRQAFFIADKYQVPTFILTDQYFLDCIATVPEEIFQSKPLENIVVETDKEYKRYALSENGVSPRGIPGYGTGCVGVDSDEHDESAHITESAAVRVAQHSKRMKKLDGIREESFSPVEMGDVKHADTIIVSWGSSRGVLEEALRKMNREDVAGLHFLQVYPLPDAAKKLLSRKKIIVLEGNFSGQFANLLTLEYKVKISGNILKYDGNPFSVEEVVAEIQKQIL